MITAKRWCLEAILMKRALAPWFVGLAPSESHSTARPANPGRDVKAWNRTRRPGKPRLLRETLGTPSEPATGDALVRRSTVGRFQRRAFLDLVSLAACLSGLIGLVVIVWDVKTATAEPSRLLFLACLALICSPFYLALVRTPKVPYLLPPLIVIFLLYPIASPHGIVFTSDPIFNFSFTNNVLSSGYWVPGEGQAFASTYSFYPLGNVFIGYVIAVGQLPGAEAYMWIEPLIRLVAVPAIVYSIGRRLFGPRTAVLGLLLYLGTASILFNVPVQQGIGVIFVGLSLLALIVLTQEPTRIAQHRVEALFVLMGAAIVMTHHLSSYIFAGWLAAVLAFTLNRRNRPAMSARHLSLLAFYFIGLLSAYILLFTYRIFLGQQLSVGGVLTGFVAPEQGPTPQAPSVGRTFSTFEIAWLGGSVLGLFLLAMVTIWRYRVTRQHPFAAANGFVACALTLITLPLIVTQLNYVPLRIGEYANLVIAPFAAATLLRFSQGGFRNPLRGLPEFLRKKKWLPAASVVLVFALLVMGGNLAPISMRTYYEPASSRTTDSQIYLGADGLRAADWATNHFDKARMWGDQLAVDVFTGFSDMRVDYGSLRFFENDTLDASAWAQLSVGDYVVVDSLMLTLRPNWLHEPLSPAPLTPGEIDKFATDPHFALVYQDATYSIYRVMSIP